MIKYITPCLLAAGVVTLAAGTADAQTLNVEPPSQVSAPPLAVSSPPSAQRQGGASEPTRVALPQTSDAVRRREEIPGSCDGSSADLCYDYRQGKAVYRPLREFMPEIAGFRRDNLSIRSDRIVMSYSFR